MNWRDHIEQWTNALKPYLDAEGVQCEIRGPATEDEIDDLEEELCFEIPECLRTFMEDESAYINFWWYLKSDISPINVSGDMPYCGYIEFGPQSIITLNSDRTGFLSDDLPNIYRRQWKQAFRILGVGNGDDIALDTFQNPDEPPVIYLNHEEPEKQVRLADSFQEFIDTWFALGCVGPEGSNIRHFVTDKDKPLPEFENGSATSKLDITCPNAIAFRSFFGLK
ncbi:MAG: SMI1/KNR4 family protein [Phycisphaerales bacterium]|nr:SMI1/KNR4 family protein [Phycisphaerales bacterium]